VRNLNGKHGVRHTYISHQHARGNEGRRLQQLNLNIIDMWRFKLFIVIQSKNTLHQLTAHSFCFNLVYRQKQVHLPCQKKSVEKKKKCKKGLESVMKFLKNLFPCFNSSTSLHITETGRRRKAMERTRGKLRLFPAPAILV